MYYCNFTTLVRTCVIHRKIELHNMQLDITEIGCESKGKRRAAIGSYKKSYVMRLKHHILSFGTTATD